MSLIPGTLPSDTCFGTPQDVLNLFAQYLDIPPFSVSSKVLYSDSSPLPNTDYIWVDTTGTQNNVLKIYNTIASTYQEYPLVGTAGSPNTLIDGKATIPSTLTGSDQVLVSKTGVLYRATLAQLGAAGKIVQVVAGSTTTPVTSTSASFVDTGLTVTITPTSASNKVLIILSQDVDVYRAQSSQGALLKVLRGATVLYTGTTDFFISVGSSTSVQLQNTWAFNYLDSPATTSATIYKVQGQILYTTSSGQIEFQSTSSRSAILAIEVSP